jgi:hypothetical protein
MKYLAIGPGSTGFFIYLGAISNLNSKLKLNDLEEIAGSSAGALVAFMYLISNKDMPKILDFAMNVSLNQIMKPNIKSLLSGYGIVPIAKIRKVLTDFCEKFKKNPDMTFQDLYEMTKIKFHVSAFCVDNSKTVYFSVDSNPTMSVIDAVCASISVPFLISASRINDRHYIDGAIAEKAPCGPFCTKDPKDVLVLVIPHGNPAQVKDIKSYGFAILAGVLFMRHEYTQFPTHKIEADFDMYDFSLSNEEKLRLFFIGNSQEFSV